MKAVYLDNLLSVPGDTLVETLDVLGIVKEDFADSVGMSVVELEDIITGSSVITLDIAEKFERVIGIPVDFWINRERNYRKELDK
jgi:HTH-type transcriptional regulator / antitoxin HigA